MKSPGQTPAQQQQFADAGQPNPLQQLFDAGLQTRGPAGIADSGRNAAEAMTAAEDGRIPTLALAGPRPGGVGDVLGQILRDPQKGQALLAMLGVG